MSGTGSTRFNRRLRLILLLAALLCVALYGLRRKALDTPSPVRDYTSALQNFRAVAPDEKSVIRVPALMAALSDPTSKALLNYYQLWERTHPHSASKTRSIPLVLHQTGPSKMLSQRWFHDRQRNWTTTNPGLVIKNYDDDDCDAFVKRNYPPFIYDAYSALPQIVMKADMFRYLVILAYGGIYSDTDTHCLKSIDEWAEGRDPSLIIGVEADLSSADLPDPSKPWHVYWMRRLQLEQWTIAGEAGHPAIVSVVWRILQKSKAWARTSREYDSAVVWQLEEGGLDSAERSSVGAQNRPPPHNDLFSTLSDVDYIENWTGPGTWTDGVLHYLTIVYNVQWKSLVGLKQPIELGRNEMFVVHNGVIESLAKLNVLIMPLVGFSPDHPQQPLSMTVEHPMACIYHEFIGSWKEENKDKLAEEGQS